jgi:beta-glucanase (GH16 family)
MIGIDSVSRKGIKNANGWDDAHSGSLVGCIFVRLQQRIESHPDSYTDANGGSCPHHHYVHKQRRTERCRDCDPGQYHHRRLDLLHLGRLNTHSLFAAIYSAISGLLEHHRERHCFTPNIPSGTLVWSDEFANSGTTDAQPNPATWAYDTGTDCCGNSELETYCAWASSTGPCNPTNPNAYVGTDNYLHIVAEQPTAGTATYTSARLKSEGLFSFQYGRIEASVMLPESQGMWPAVWMLGNNITTEPFPACGEMDIMEHIDGNNTPFGGPGTGSAPGFDWTQSSVHGTNLNGGTPCTTTGFSAAAWHTYGVIWTKGQVQYYVDSPSNIYETFTASTQSGTWPFDQGPQFVILNLAVGGDWPGSPDATTVFPSQMLVDYVRIYTP